MALSATGVFEVRADTGSDSNGGNYDPGVTSPGTDLTYPTSAPVSITDLVIHASTTTKVKSASAVALSAVPNGNGINVTGGTGFTTGLYEVTGNDGTYWILDRAAGTAGSTGGTGIAGGAKATPGSAVAVMVGGNDCYVKQGTYTCSATNNVAGGRVTLPDGAGPYNATRLIGYNATRGDNPADSSRPTLQASAGSVSIVSLGNQCHVSNLIVDGNSKSSILGIDSSSVQYCKIVRCKVMGCSNGGVKTYANATFVSGCEVTTCSSGYPFSGGGGVAFHGCHAHGNTSTSAGFGPTGIGYVCIDCLSAGNGGPGFGGQDVSEGMFTNCVAYGNAGDGFNLKGYSSRGGANVNCLAVGNGGAGFNQNGASDSGVLLNCAAYNNTGGSYPAGDFTVEGFVALTADPFVNASGGDYRLNNSSGGGAAIRGAGLPQTFPGLSSANARDVGAYQHTTPALGLTVNTGGTNPVLTWDADPRVATGYVVLRGTSASNLAEIATVSASTTTYTDASVSSGTYVYSVASY